MYTFVTYWLVLFTIQCWLITQYASSAIWLVVLWVFGFLLLRLYGQQWLWPKDHPYYGMRLAALRWLQISCIALIVVHAYLQLYVSLHQTSAWQNVGLADEGEFTVQGTIASFVEIDGDRVRFELDVVAAMPKGEHRTGYDDDVHISRGERMVVTRYMQTRSEIDQWQEVARSDQWQGVVQVEQPAVARNPGAFDYRLYLKRQGIFYTARVTEAEWYAEPSSRLASVIMRFLDRQRQTWSKQVNQLFEPESAAIVQAMTVGDRTAIDGDVLHIYQSYGIVHLLAISGLHVGILLGIAHLVLSYVPITKETRYTILLLLIPLYIVITGMQVSVVRAGLMAMVAIICLRYGGWRTALPGLFIVYTLLLLYNPYYLYQVGFQLSFAVTFALLTIYPLLDRMLPIPFRPLRTIIGVALVAQIASLPFIMYHFHQFAPISLFLNIVLVPIYSIIFIPLAFILPLFSWGSLDLVTVPALIYDQSLTFIQHFLAQSTSQKWMTVFHTGQPGWWWLSLFWAVIILACMCWEGNKRLVGWIVLTSGCIVLLSVQQFLPYMNPVATVTMLDVGQGDAIIIELPYREAVVAIDMGGQFDWEQEEWRERSRTFEVGSDIILPFLKYRGIGHVDHVFISHGHYDHYGGMEGLFENIRIDNVYRSPIDPQSEEESAWLDKVLAAGIRVYELERGMYIQDEHALFYVLFPEKPLRRVQQVANIHDYNIVLFNQIYSTRFIWTGDVEVTGEMDIIRTYPQLEADILKIAHHGSATSSSKEWIRHVDAQVGIVSLGRHNRYGHPHPDVVQRLENHEIPLYRTDKYGAIQMDIRPNRWEIRPMIVPE